MVHVASGGDHLHDRTAPTSFVIIARVDAPQVEETPVAFNTSYHRGDSRFAAAPSSAPGRLTAQPGKTTPGALPPPTAPLLGTTSA